jgi:hypothetical protein
MQAGSHPLDASGVTIDRRGALSSDHVSNILLGIPRNGKQNCRVLQSIADYNVLAAGRISPFQRIGTPRAVPDPVTRINPDLLPDQA